MNDSPQYPERKDASRHIEVLRQLREWDPIGVFTSATRHDPAAPGFDEYDSYAPAIVRLLDAGTDATTLTHHLASLAERTFSISADPARTAEIAAALLRA